MSCNGCRVLRKGCSEDCILRPSLQWIKSSNSQANATLFLAKFYGRAGLVNLINTGPAHLRAAILESLLYEACGRIINPTQGSVGLMCSGKWEQCHSAVEAVLKGAPLVIQTSDGGDESSATVYGQTVTPLQGGDIRRFHKDSVSGLHRVRTRNRLKRSAKRHIDTNAIAELMGSSEVKFTITGWDCENFEDREVKRAPSQDSNSMETVELDLVMIQPEEPVERVAANSVDFENEIGLELTLGFSKHSPNCSDRHFR